MTKELHQQHVARYKEQTALRLRSEGWTQKRIAVEFGATPTRISQILRRADCRGIRAVTAADKP